jgi:hypothetical protein
VVRVQAAASIEEEWECFKDAILRTLEDLCGLRIVGAGGKKSEWLQGVTRIEGFEKAVVPIRANPQWSLCGTLNSSALQ